VTALFSIAYKWDVFRMGRNLQGNPLLESIEYNLKRASKDLVSVEKKSWKDKQGTSIASAD
jgi:hypothetical protein